MPTPCACTGNGRQAGSQARADYCGRHDAPTSRDGPSRRSLPGVELGEKIRSRTKLAQQHDGKDRWYLEALGLALDKQQDKFFGAWLEAIGSDWDTPAGRDIIWRSRSSKTSDLLVKILLNKKTKDEEKPRYIRALDFQSGPEKDAALIKLIGAGS